MSKRLMTIVGARPQFIKAAPVSKAIRELDKYSEQLVHTGQHFDADMSEVFFKELGIPEPAHHLGIAGGGHGAMTGAMLSALESLFIDALPNAVMVYGDTNSTLAGALAAAKLDIPVIHVEAGLRSFRRSQPEEINRVMTDHISSVLFCPTPNAVALLAREGISENVHNIGDVMYDMALIAAASTTGSDIAKRLGLGNQYQVATLHRQENTDDPAAFAEALNYLKRASKETLGPVVLPVHPRTRKAAERDGQTFDGLVTCGPLGYFDMAHLVKGAKRVLTDSGGLQKEAYFHGVPCITLRDETEWTETVDAGWNRLWKGEAVTTERRPIDQYGQGDAAIKVAKGIADFLDV